MLVVQFEDIVGRRREASHEFRHVGVVVLPVRVFLVELGQSFLSCLLCRLALTGMADVAGGHVHGVGAEEDNGLALGQERFPRLVPELDLGVLVGLELLGLDAPERALALAVAECRERQSQGVPEIGRGQRERNVLDRRDQGVGKDLVPALAAGIGQVAAGQRFA